MSSDSSTLKDAALVRYKEIDGVIAGKREEIDALMVEHRALKGYLISMNILQEEPVVKRRGRKPKDKSMDVPTEKKKRGRKKKDAAAEGA